MFGRKPKGGAGGNGGSELNASLARFADVHRECFSRVKHLKILLETLPLHEKRLLIEEHSFEVFHLVDELLVSCDAPSSPQGAAEAEHGLWTLEQLLCLAPHLVGKGWQRHAIECMLKKAIYPHNVLAVRKAAIRMFLIFYQSLAVYNNTTPQLDKVLQSLLPYFPLASGENTHNFLLEYCQSAGSVHGGRCLSATVESATGPRERAQLLQVYLDKLLEYCCRESVRIEWEDEEKRTICADFILHKIITLFVEETFPDMETNGVDIFNGWEGGDAEVLPLETSDPLVIARYWLIRWFNNVASATQLPAETRHNGLLLYHKALFSSHRATNCLLSLMCEAMRLPLPCSNVIHKVVGLVSSWLLQKELAPFVASGEVSVEKCSLLFIHTLLSFFQSPYLEVCGDRVDTAVSITFSILHTCRQLASPTTTLRRPLPPSVWNELVCGVASACARVSSLSPPLSHDTAAAFSATLLSILTTTYVGVSGGGGGSSPEGVDECVWEEGRRALHNAPWTQCTEEWGKALQCTTRALVYRLIHLDIHNYDSNSNATRTESSSSSSRVRRLRERASGGGEGGEGGVVGVEEAEERREDDTLFNHSQDTLLPQLICSTEGDVSRWLCAWRRMCLLVSLNGTPAGRMAASTLAATSSTLFSLGLHPLGTWLVEHLLSCPAPLLPCALPAFVACLNCPHVAPSLQAACVVAVRQVVVAGAPNEQVLASLNSLRPLHLSLLSHTLLSALPPSSTHPHDELLTLISELSFTHTLAENWLLRQVSSTEMSLKQRGQCVKGVSCVSVLRGDAALSARLLSSLLSPSAPPSLLHLFASSAVLIPKKDQQAVNHMVEVLCKAVAASSEERMSVEMLSLLSAIVVQCSLSPKQVREVLHLLSSWHSTLCEGTLVCHSGQFPLPSFTVAMNNSLPSTSTSPTVYMRSDASIIAASGCEDGSVRVTSRSRVARHSWTFTPLSHKREEKKRDNVTHWLSTCTKRQPKKDKAPAILGTMGDGLETLSDDTAAPLSAECAAVQEMIERKRRRARERKREEREGDGGRGHTQMEARGERNEWRSVAVTVPLVHAVSQSTPAFTRLVNHLDSTPSRETHKVAVIYVALGQEDKNCILSNRRASAAFDAFVGGLGWEWRVGMEEVSYTGGLTTPNTPFTYHATPHYECVFHVSTRLNGDVAHRLKHIGNDEVHIVWNEHCRPYKRDTIATQFCDILFVVERVSTCTLRINIQTRTPLDATPLWDGIVVFEEDAPSLLRAAAINASRAYRLSRDTVRPTRHREGVLNEVMSAMQPLSLSSALSQAFIPLMANSA